MVLKLKDAEDLRKLGRASERFGKALDRLAAAHPPKDRPPTPHTEISRLTRELDGAAGIVEKAADAKFMTAAQYERVARHFEAIAEGMERGALKEFAAEKRRAAPRRRRATPAVRKPRSPHR